MRFLIKTVVLLVVVAAILVTGLSLAVVERAPLVARPEPPTSADVAAAREMLHQFRAATRGDGAVSSITVSPGQAAAFASMGARVFPGARGETEFGAGALRVRGALPLPVGGLWVNATATVPAFDDGVLLSELRVGHLSIPPGLALWLSRQGLSLVLGDGAGEMLIGAFPQMDVTPDAATLAVNVDRQGRSDMARSFFSVFRGAGMPDASEVIAYRSALVEEIESGRLAPGDGFAPLLAFALQQAYDRGRDGDLAREYTAAIFALTSACGSELIRGGLGKLLPGGVALDGFEGDISPCGEAGLHDRVDLRRHFITAATLQAASNRGVAVSIGEFKELSDMANGGSGFDFTDIVANNSGIRLSDRLMGAEASEWAAILPMLQAEANFIAPLAGIPTAMTMQEFVATYQDLDSPQYRAILDEIEGRIDVLPVHTALTAGAH